MAAGDCERGHEEIDVRRGVGRAHLDRLLLAGVVLRGRLLRVRLAAHVGPSRPAERNADENRAVAVAPAHVRRRLLVGNEPEVARRIGVAERGDRRRELHHAGDSALRGVGDAPVLEHLVHAVLHEAHVDVEPRPRLADGDLRGERHVVAVLRAEVADHPLRDHELVRGLLRGAGQELDLVLLVDETVLGEVADLAVAVLDEAARLRYREHALLAELAELRERRGLVVAALVLRGERLGVGRDDVVLELAHRLELEPRLLRERVARLLERVLGARLKRLAVLVEERAEKAERRKLGKRIDERGRVARDDVEVGRARLDVGEERGTVHTLAARQYLVEILVGVDDEVERLEPTVAACVHEVDVADVLRLDEALDVGLREGRARFSEERHYVGEVEFYLVFHLYSGFVFA